MRFDFQNYTPGEAETITGASTALHRDWRRRGILPANEDGKHARFNTHGVAQLLALKAFSDSGVSVLDAGEAAQEAALRTVDMLIPIFSEDHHRHRWPWTPQERRFVVVTDKSIMVGSNLADLGPKLARDDGSPVAIVYDALLAARRILERAPRPVFVEVG